MWVIHHFRVLPTDPRFERMTDRQKLLCLEGYLNLSTSDEVRLEHLNKLLTPKVDETAAQGLMGHGYSKEQVAEIQKELMKVAEHGRPDQ